MANNWSVFKNLTAEEFGWPAWCAYDARTVKVHTFDTHSDALAFANTAAGYDRAEVTS